MKAKKYNFILKKWEDVEINDNWYCPINGEIKDNEKINCVNCGKKIKYKNSFYSKQYLNNYKLNFKVCEDCHIMERYLEKMSEEIQDNG